MALLQHANSNSTATLIRKHVSVECRHDMRPSVQLPSVSCSGADSNLGLTYWRRPSLKSSPDPPALDRPPVSKQDASFVWFLRPVTLTFDFDLFDWKLALHLLVPWELYADFDFSTFFLFSSYISVSFCTGQTYRQMDVETEGRARG